jgi:hypothetical protein
METYELFELPEDHWTWVAMRELPWPHTGMGYVGCCGRCGSLTYTPRVGYAAAWNDCDTHHRERRGVGPLAPTPDDPNRIPRRSAD